MPLKPVIAANGAQSLLVSPQWILLSSSATYSCFPAGYVVTHLISTFYDLPCSLHADMIKFGPVKYKSGVKFPGNIFLKEEACPLCFYLLYFVAWNTYARTCALAAILGYEDRLTAHGHGLEGAWISDVA